MNFKEEYESYKLLFETELNNKLNSFTNLEPKLFEAMKYSVNAGGKRFRPVLMLMTATTLGLEVETVMPYAISLELIHTYSLIHDDLPAMDNDDFRRGKPTNHKIFGEAMAILAGDALLNLAYEILFREIKSVYSLNACRILSNYAGAHGMVGGQSIDVNFTNYNTATESELYNMHLNKTGKLIIASTVIPSCFAKDEHFAELKEYGENLGLLFQITDDLLDVTASFNELGKTIGKDESKNKLTFVSLYGYDGAVKKASEVYLKVINSAKQIKNSKLLIAMADYVYNRKG